MASNALVNLRANAADKSRITYEDIVEEFETCCGNNADQIVRSKLSIAILVDVYRNLENSQWKERVDGISLSKLILKCSRNVICSSDIERKQFLTSLCNLHRFLVKQDIPLDLGMKLSAPILHPTSPDNYSSQFSQIYWIVFVDKVSFIEQNKWRVSVEALYSGVVSEAVKVMQSSELVSFCKEKLLWLLNRMLQMFGDGCEMLHVCYKQIFLGLTSHNLMGAEQNRAVLSCKDALFKSLFRSFSLVMQGAYRHGFKKNALIYAVKFSMALLKDVESVIGLLAPIYSCLPPILVHYASLPLSTWRILQKFLHLLKKVDDDVLKVAVPNLSRIICLHVDHISKPDDLDLWKTKISSDLLLQYLELMMYLMHKMAVCEETVTCEKCPVRSGLHECIRIWLSGRPLLMTSLKSRIDLNQNIIHSIKHFTSLQLSLPLKLRDVGCINWYRYFKTHATDLHNDSIVFFEYRQLELARYLLHSCLLAEIQLYTNAECDMEPTHMSNRFYNLGLCEFDMKNHEMALMCSFAAAACGESPGSFSLAVKVKHGARNNAGSILPPKAVPKHSGGATSHDDHITNLQMTSCLDSAIALCGQKGLENMAAVFADIGDFSPLLLKEVQTYVELWGATHPLAGVCRAFTRLIGWAKGIRGPQPEWLSVPHSSNGALHGGTALILAANTTSSLTRPEFEELAAVVVDCLKEYHSKMVVSAEWSCFHNTIVLAACLFLKTEFKMASVRQNLNALVSNVNLSETADETREFLPPGLTLEEEGKSLGCALEAVDLWVTACRIVKDPKGKPIKIPDEGANVIRGCVRLLEANLELLRIHSASAAAIKIAWAAAQIGIALKETSAILRSVGFLASISYQISSQLEDLILEADSLAAEILSDSEEHGSNNADISLALCYLLDLAVYKKNVGELSVGAAILKSVHSFIVLGANVDCDYISKIGVAYPRILEVQALFSSSSGVGRRSGDIDYATQLSVYTNAYRENIMLRKNVVVAPRSAASYHSLRTSISLGDQVTDICSNLSLIRRARTMALSTERSAAKSGLNARAACLLLKVARTSAECNRTDDCQSKLNAVRHIIGLKEVPSPENLEKPSSGDPEEITSIADCFASSCAVTVMSTPMKLPEIILKAASIQKKISPLSVSPAAEESETWQRCECALCTDPSRLLLEFQYVQTCALDLFRRGDTVCAKAKFEECFEIADSIYEKLTDLKADLSKTSPICAVIFEEDFLEGFHKDQCLALVNFSYLLLSLGDLDEAVEIIKKIIYLNDSLKLQDVYLIQKVLELASTIIYESKLIKVKPNNSLILNRAVMRNLVFSTPTASKDKVSHNRRGLTSLRMKNV